MTRTILATLVAVTVAMPAAAFAAARAELRPSGELAVDTPAQLVVTVDHDGATAPDVHARDATVRYSGQMANISIVNGHATRQTSFIYTVVPHATGTLSIPAVRVGGEQTDPIEATVVAARAGAPRNAPLAGSSPRSALPRGAQAQAKAEREPTRAFIRFDVPKRTLYVGEAVPVRIRAYFRGGVSATLQGAPHIASSAFTLSQLSDKPEQTQVELDGVPYLQATWTAVLSPAKPTHDKLSIELPVEIAYRERRAMARPSVRSRPTMPATPSMPSMRDLLANGPFGTPFGEDLDAFFDDPFFTQDPFAGIDTMFDIGPMRQQQLTLRDTASRTRIAELPDDGKPKDFGGAVGSFELSVEPPSGELHTGEPATVTFAITGTGNFDRVDLAGLAASSDWKVYPGKTELETDGDSNARGTKTFTQTIVPVHDGSLEVPAVAFSYFDPEAAEYRTVHTEPVTLAVAPAPGGGAADPGLVTSSVRDAGMRPNRADLGATRTTLVPLIRQDSFWLWPGALAAATALLLAAAFWRRSAWARDRVRAQRVAHAVRHQRKRLDRAARDGDAEVFFEAARTALQLHLAAEWNVTPETITAADVSARLGERGRAIRDVFEHADQLTYAHGIATPTALDRWRAIVDEQLAKEV